MIYTFNFEFLPFFLPIFRLRNKSKAKQIGKIGNIVLDGTTLHIYHSACSVTFIHIHAEMKETLNNEMTGACASVLE